VTYQKMFNSYEIFYDRTRKRWLLNTGLTVITMCKYHGTCNNIVKMIVVCRVLHYVSSWTQDQDLEKYCNPLVAEGEIL
jgi:hypothetical protein